ENTGEETRTDRSADCENPTETERNEAHRRGCTALWTTVSGFESLPRFSSFYQQSPASSSAFGFLLGETVENAVLSAQWSGDHRRRAIRLVERHRPFSVPAFQKTSSTSHATSSGSERAGAVTYGIIRWTLSSYRLEWPFPMHSDGTLV